MLRYCMLWLLGVFVSVGFAAEANFHGTLLERPRVVSAFNEKQLQGHWTFVFFGFTHCRYMCPATMAELRDMYRMIGQHKVKQLPQVMMISIDPERDSQEIMQKYVAAFNPTFIGISYNTEFVEKLTKELGILYITIAQKDKNSYDIDHSGTVMLFNPEGKLQAFFSPPLKAEELTADYLLLTKKTNRT